jgi:hypothetical protein
MGRRQNQVGALVVQPHNGSVTRFPDSVEVLLREIRAEQTRQAGVLADILRALDRGRTSLAVHVALLVAIAEAIGDRDFTGAQLFAHARVAPALREALEACDLTSPREFGWLARRLEGSVLPGVRLDRVGESSAGLQWRVWVSSGETHDG